jgi:glycosyltransferase involved in cell wall biosynthesis
MTKVLILCAHRAGRSPSQRYRFEQYLDFLRSNGFVFHFSNLLSEQDDQTFYSKDNFLRKVLILIKGQIKRMHDARTFSGYDLIFIQREAGFLGNSIFEKRAFKSGATVIFDFDDSIWLADTSPGNKKWEWIKKPRKFYHNIRYAHTVIAGNEYLANEARKINPNTVIIPTTVDTKIHVPKPDLRGKGPVVIGWSGSLSTIKHWEVLVPVLLQLKKKYRNGVHFKILVDTFYSVPDLGLEYVKWSPENEVDVINSFDIGVMPLPDDEWTRGKCGLKGLTYMGCSVPAVMSPVGVNKEIVRHNENGMLVKDDQEWLSALSILIEDRGLRERMGKEGRKTVLEKYSVAANEDKYLQVFKGA